MGFKINFNKSMAKYFYGDKLYGFYFTDTANQISIKYIAIE